MIDNKTFNDITPAIMKIQVLSTAAELYCKGISTVRSQFSLEEAVRSRSPTAKKYGNELRVTPSTMNTNATIQKYGRIINSTVRPAVRHQSERGDYDREGRAAVKSNRSTRGYS